MRPCPTTLINRNKYWPTGERGGDGRACLAQNGFVECLRECALLCGLVDQVKVGRFASRSPEGTLSSRFFLFACWVTISARLSTESVGCFYDPSTAVQSTHCRHHAAVPRLPGFRPTELTLQPKLKHQRSACLYDAAMP